jgi:hypothetical protein
MRCRRSSRGLAIGIRRRATTEDEASAVSRAHNLLAATPRQ